ncbi:MSMEG_1061 family FMN-dependent PPOX-type flavoprotein [Marinomonas profundimaris]|uniref:Phosphohydrolase n=1 Tax=Marinomonas profundimaris TaxID=1208321 RepID=W1S0C0_9GAMM|nr:MSMEG_1061 family FMN-dependent PPOX-type flavoprotein [Marinomonas profundimaris]ETI60538.1 phosphohydrolase [Marinomonas profundimaris]
MSQITDLKQLTERYNEVHPLALIKEIPALEEHAITFIGNCPFVILSTSDKDGFADVSPRGGDAGFIKVLDSKTIAFADSAGNNRLDSLRNIVERPEIGMLFMIPGIGEVVRVKGTASLHTDSELLDLFSENNKPPKLVVKIDVHKLLFHCPKAIAIAKLWSEDNKVDRTFLPSLLRIIQEQTGTAE